MFKKKNVSGQPRTSPESFLQPVSPDRLIVRVSVVSLILNSVIFLLTILFKILHFAQPLAVPLNLGFVARAHLPCPSLKCMLLWMCIKKIPVFASSCPTTIEGHLRPNKKSLMERQTHHQVKLRIENILLGFPHQCEETTALFVLVTVFALGLFWAWPYIGMDVLDKWEEKKRKKLCEAERCLI